MSAGKNLRASHGSPRAQPKEKSVFFDKRSDAAETLYKKVAAETDNYTFSTLTGGKLPNRSPYLKGAKMGRGAHFAGRFKQFVEEGGIAKYKNCVVMNIRLNDLRDIDSADGNGTFKASFFLDTAFWVPMYDSAHFESKHNLGTFSRFEPVLEFPYVDVEAGDLRWLQRICEFSRHKKSRQHEVQLGQTHDTVLSAGKVALKSAVLGRAARNYNSVSVEDAGAHWPRLWRVCVSNEELQEIKALPTDQRKMFEPTNEHPKRCHDRLIKLFTQLDEDRKKNLKHPTEGIAFITYEISCTHRCEFQLHEFPFDMHNLNLVVRLSKKDLDPMNRIIVPIAHDKAFFISSRVKSMVEYHLARSLSWEVTKEPISFGGYQRLNASASVRRKPGYYVRNYVVIIFLLTSSAFSCFLSRPDDLETRAAIIFTVLLSVVAFKYSGGDQMPRVSYATILDAYILLNFYIVLCVGVINFGFSMVCSMGGTYSENYDRKVQRDVTCSLRPGERYGLDFIPPYDPVIETCFGLFFFGVWLGMNALYWSKVFRRIRFNLSVINDVNIGWMVFKAKRGTVEGQFPAENFVERKEDVLQVEKKKQENFNRDSSQGVMGRLAANIDPRKWDLKSLSPRASRFGQFFETVAEVEGNTKTSEQLAEEAKAASLIQSIARRKQIINKYKEKGHEHEKRALRGKSAERGESSERKA